METTNNEKIIMIPVKKRVLVTGAGGFIGSFLIDYLMAQTSLEIMAIDIRSLPPIVGIKSIICDFSNTEKLTKVLRPEDTVVHLACSTIPVTSESDILADTRENLLGTINLLEVCRKKKISKIVFISSGGTIYGNTKSKPASENQPITPLNKHGLMKSVVEKYIEYYSNNYGFDHAIIRLSNPYGRSKITEDALGAADVFLHKTINEKPISIWGNGQTVRDFIHIDDVISFISKAISKKEIEGTYNIGTGRGTSLNDLITMIQKITNKKSKTIYKKARVQDVTYNVLNIKKALKTGWKPRIRLEDGLRLIYRKYYEKK